MKPIDKTIAAYLSVDTTDITSAWNQVSTQLIELVQYTDPSEKTSAGYRVCSQLIELMQDIKYGSNW